MIVYKRFFKEKEPNHAAQLATGKEYMIVAMFDGWFLFGFIPLYIRQTSDWN